MKRGLEILLIVLMVFTMGTGTFAAQEATVVVLDAYGAAIKGVPVLDNQSRVYETNGKGRAVVSTENGTVVRVPAVYQDANGVLHQFGRQKSAAAAENRIIFQAVSSAAAEEISMEEGLYRAVRDAAAKQSSYAAYWIEPSVEGSALLNQTIQRAIDRVRREFPGYYVSNTTDVGYYSFQSDGQYNMLEYKLTYFLPDQERRDQVSGLVQEIAASAKGTEYQKLKYFHDYLINNCEYDLEASQSNSTTYPNAFNAYGALIEGKAVCEGYANAFKMLCDAAGIESYVVTGVLNGPHAWNYVRLDGALYLVDCTSDDPIGGSPRWDFFLAGSEKSSAYRPDSSAPGKLSETSYRP